MKIFFFKRYEELLSRVPSVQRTAVYKLPSCVVLRGGLPIFLSTKQAFDLIICDICPMFSKGENIFIYSLHCSSQCCILEILTFTNWSELLVLTSSSYTSHKQNIFETFCKFSVQVFLSKEDKTLEILINVIILQYKDMKRKFGYLMRCDLGEINLSSF